MFFNMHHSSFADTLMYMLTAMGEAWFITVVLLILLGNSAYRNWWYLVAALASNIIPSIVTQMVKSAVAAPRPLKYFNEAAWIHTLPDWPRLMERSFPSGHTCGAFSFYCLLSLLLPPKYKPWGILFFILALLVGYSRMYIAVHFFEDVYVGSILGCLVSLGVITIMNRYHYVFFGKVKQ